MQSFQTVECIASDSPENPSSLLPLSACNPVALGWWLRYTGVSLPKVHYTFAWLTFIWSQPP